MERQQHAVRPRSDRKHMKAWFCDRYGGPERLESRDVARPEPKPGEVLVRVRAASVTRTDTSTMRGVPRFARIVTGLGGPRHAVLGMDFAGEVEAVGEGVTGFAPGERVFGYRPERFGAHAAHVVVPAEAGLAKLPEGVDFAHGLICEGAWYAETYMRAFRVGPGFSLLVFGASGAIGSAAVQLARLRGAHVTALVEARHMEMAAQLGADELLDAQATDIAALGPRFDAVLDAVGKTRFAACRPALKPRGLFSATELGEGGENIRLALRGLVAGRPKVIFPVPRPDHGLPARLAPHLADGSYRAIVDSTWAFDDLPAAMAYVEQGRKAGIAVLDVAPDGN